MLSIRKLIFISILFSSIYQAQAQPESLNTKALSAKVMAKLESNLGFSATQRPSIKQSLDSFFIKKSAFFALKKTDPEAYAAKFNLLNGDLMNHLKSILLARQMSSFLSLKPHSDNPENLLSQLFY